MELSQDGKVEMENLCKYTQISITTTLEFISSIADRVVRGCPSLPGMSRALRHARRAQSR
jgi:hypothetical protein